LIVAFLVVRFNCSVLLRFIHVHFSLFRSTKDVFCVKRLGNLAVSLPLCFSLAAWQFDTERVLQLNDIWCEAKGAGISCNVSSQAPTGSRRAHPGRPTTLTTPKLFAISFMPFCQVTQCPPRGLRHSKEGTEKNARLGRPCFGRESGQKLWGAIMSAAKKCADRVKQRIEEYLEKDGLGEKLADVIKILAERLTKRIETYVKE
ncbi:hypothetical protein T265_13308, partial [Opisthorchis viverrini]